MSCTRFDGNAGPRKSPKKFAIWAPSHNLVGYILATTARMDNRKKMLSSNVSPICLHNIVNFGPLAAEICWRVWAPLQISTGFESWQRYCTAL